MTGGVMMTGQGTKTVMTMTTPFRGSGQDGRPVFAGPTRSS